jgi:hypothetical protein
MTVARPGGQDNARKDLPRLILEYIRALPPVLTGLTALVVALTGLIALIAR